MVSTNEFKTGMTIIYEGQIYQVIEFMHVKPGKGNTFVRTTIRNLRTGALLTDYRFDAGIKVERAVIDKTPMSYLYKDGLNQVFMNMETYEQVEIPISQIEWESNFIYDGLEVLVNIFNSKNGTEILGITLPDKVTLEIVDTISGVKGDNTKTNSLKDSITNTGLLVKVPMFIENGEKIIVSTYDGSYVSRDK
ncbi:MAG: elongation factor P [Acholeplasmatales bacterium]|jgi:elongation factor P|nr:elongation factor P [Acholeplasmatales bacterium]